MKGKFTPADEQNFDKRHRFIILHYTVLEEQDSVETLTRGGMGAHFLIPKQPLKKNEEQFDYYKILSYENSCLACAGVNSFSVRSGLNNASIGIEIVNYGYGLVQDAGKVLFTYEVENQLKKFITQTLQEQDENLYLLLTEEKLLTDFLTDMMRSLVLSPNHEVYKKKVSQEHKAKYKQLTKEWREKNDAFLHIKQEDLYPLEQQGKLTWDEYTDYQIEIVVDLIKEIQEKIAINDDKNVYYQVLPQFIVGHADIAPGRKSDPGPRLWKKLAERGIGAWPDEPLRLSIEEEIHIDQGIDYKWIQDNLRYYGYKIDSTGQLDVQTKNVIRAFQMHFEPENYSGEPSVKTISLLEALIKKYYPSKQSNYPRNFGSSVEKIKFFASPSEDHTNSETNNCMTRLNCCLIS